MTNRDPCGDHEYDDDNGDDDDDDEYMMPLPMVLCNVETSEMIY